MVTGCKNVVSMNPFKGNKKFCLKTILKFFHNQPKTQEGQLKNVFSIKYNTNAELTNFFYYCIWWHMLVLCFIVNILFIILLNNHSKVKNLIVIIEIPTTLPIATNLLLNTR